MGSPPDTQHSHQISYLADNILHQFVHSKANIGMDSEHLPQSVLILRWVNIAIQQTPHHIQERRVVLLQFHLTWVGEKCSHLMHVRGRVKSGDTRDSTARET